LYACDPSTGTPGAPGTGTPIDSQTTDENGEYVFECLDPNLEYYIEVGGTPQNVVPSDDTCSNGDTVPVDDNGQSGCLPPWADCETPYVPCPNLSGTVFIDNDEDGCVDDAEGDTLLEGITVTLYECDPVTQMQMGSTNSSALILI